MSEVGTVRREEHDGGYSVWVLVQDCCREEWLCIESTTVGNRGERIDESDFDSTFCPVIGVVPGSSADGGVS